MPETIYKLQPNRTLHLRGFDDRGAAASLYAASPTGFTVSGVFRDSADFAVLMLWDADDFFGHPRLKYLPDFDFSDMVLSFDLHYRNLQPIDSPKYPTIDWPYLDVIKTDGTTAQVNLFHNAVLNGGTYTPATGIFTVQASGVQQYDRVTIWFQNIAFDYIAAGGETAAQVANTLANQINNLDWTTQGPAVALWAHTLREQITITVARYGRVSTSGQLVTLVAGQNFSGMQVGDAIRIGSQETTVSSIQSPTQLTVSGDMGTNASIAYLAARGGYDGNMITMYSVAKNSRLQTAQSTVKFSGGSSDATWKVTLDFSALGITQIRKMWLTFAPRLVDSMAYPGEEWDAFFTNWQVTDALGKRALKVAGPNSVRVEETDAWCTYSGSSWTSTIGFFSKGFANVSNTIGDSVTVKYWCQMPHDLWIGTSLYKDRGMLGVSVDQDAETLLDCYLNDEPQVNTRRQVRTGLAAGQHTVMLTVRAANPSSSGNNCYFDYLEAVVASDVPDAPGTFATRSPAIDYDTDHTYKLSPQRLLWMFDKLGLTGPMNEYIGVFWWNQRQVTGNNIPSVQVTFSGNFQTNDQIFMNIGGQIAGKTVFPNENNTLFANHFAYFINETYSGVWAQSLGNILTITSRAATAAYNFTFSTSTQLTQGSTGKVTTVGSLEGGVKGTWIIDPTQQPPLNYALRQWHADFFNEVEARNRTVVVAFSMELVNPPDNPATGQVWAARYLDGTAVQTDTGFGVLRSTHCAFVSNVLAYQQKAFKNVADLMAAAGLTPELQCGEFLWWFFTNYNAGTNPLGGMAYYDQETSAAASAALGRPLASFISPNDDPSVNGYADTNFLRNRLRDHVAGVRTYVQGFYPSAKFEVLWPYDVNYPQVYGRYNLGGRLNNYVNLPTEWQNKATSGLDRIKIEALDFGAGTRSLDLALQAIRLPKMWGWPLDSIRYLFPIFNGGCPWEWEYLLTVWEQIPSVTPFAMDHFCLFGWRVEEPVLQASAQIV